MADESPALEHSIPLYEMIQELRRQLGASMKAGKDEALRFEVKDIELELHVAVSREHEVGGGVKFWVLDATGGHKAASHTTHTFKLKLAPVTGSDGKTPLLVGDESAKKPA